MPYKDSKKQYESQHQYYLKNKEKYRDNVRRTRKERLKWFSEIRSSLKCKKCGENHPGALDFHHINSEEKEGVIGRMVNEMRSKKKILAEIDKCDVLCANCHRILHWNIHKNVIV